MRDETKSGEWKSCTHPGTFQGAGVKALKWLQRIKDEFNLKIAVEVAFPHHVEVCLKHGIDVFWIGARTVSNPFSVEELSAAFCGKSIDPYSSGINTYSDKYSQ